MRERRVRERRVRVEYSCLVEKRVSVIVLVVVAASAIASPSDPYHQPTYKPESTPNQPQLLLLQDEKLRSKRVPAVIIHTAGHASVGIAGLERL
ncbi:hypothetical protein Pmani_034353 [Petrolisthes manimaculis]|uniref:Uncharacterized protein n=1 Tax=Petrolisthes manimaculis TaxID=1843537 RepID=A0AAE1TPH3_9EUCA|nr:hypothetical protein Pmani_034353 [Petrolisthes manimaculis]